MNDLERLMELVRPPPTPAEVATNESWTEVEHHFGVVLPSDFKTLLDACGSGSLDDFLYLLNPGSARPGLNFRLAAEEILAMQREIRVSRDLPYPIYPEPGGLLPWGRTSNGNNAFWVTTAPDTPDAWAIAVDEPRSRDWFVHPGPVARFLLDAVSRQVVVHVFPDDWPETNPRFIPMHLLSDSPEQ